MTTRDESQGETRFAPPQTAAAVAPPPTLRRGNEGLLEAIRELHPEPLASMFYEAELKRRATLLETHDRLQARLSVLRAAWEIRNQDGGARLAPLTAAMEAARIAWDEACIAYNAQRIQNQSALVPLENEIAALVAELNRPAFADRFRQWTVPDWYQPLPDVPPLGFGPRT
jgi:hypothetical protein